MKDSVRIKLCGMMTEDDIVAANSLMPDYIGFIFVEKSKRYVNPMLAKELGDKLNKDIIKVGVFVDAPISHIMSLVENGVIDMIQLHGKEDDTFIQEIRSLSGQRVIKAFGIEKKEDIVRVNECNADYVLLDSPRGGSGIRFNHELLLGVNRDYFLAGGLDASNVSDILKKHRPFAVDVSSGIETEGKKDPLKMKDFVFAVRQS